MSWIVFALLSVFTASASYLFQKILMKDEKADALATGIVFQFTGAFITLIYALIRGFAFPPIFEMPLQFLFCGVLYGMGTFFLFKAYQYAEASEVIILTSTRAIVTILTALLFLGEAFPLTKTFGTILILGAVCLVSQKKGGKLSLNKGVLYALGVAVCYGAAVTNDAYVLQKVSVIAYTPISFFLPGLFLLLIHPQVIKKFPAFLKPLTLRNMLIMSTFYSVAALSFYTALELHAPASQIAPINQSQVIVTVLLAAIFLKERDHLPKKTLRRNPRHYWNTSSKIDSRHRISCVLLSAQQYAEGF